MADQLQIRGGDTASNSTFTGAQRELSIDTSKNQLIVHDGVTPGGHPIPNTNDPTFAGDAEFSGSIYVGGAATFTGNVNVGDISTSSGGTQISAAGYFYLRSAGADAATPVIDVYNLNNTRRAGINADGSAEFGGGGFKIDGNGYIQSNIQSAGFLQLDSTASFSSPKIELSSVDGSAKFVGRVKAADVVAGDATFAGPYCYIGPTEITLNASSTSPLFKVNSGGNIIKAGSASFSGTVTATNITAFKSRMASAVASAADLSTLKQAILDAVADL